MAENAHRNPYVLRALERLRYGNFDRLERKLEEEGQVVIPNVVTLAFVLEKITSNMIADWRFLKLCNRIWAAHDNVNKIIKSSRGELFKVAKVLTIEEVMERRIRTLETGHVRKKTSINALVVNIMEAVLEDRRRGNFDNANTGLILAQYPHSEEYDPRTGSGPCQLSPSNQTVQCSQPLNFHWVDLYTTWNLAFVSAFPDFVYFVPKLLIPSVGNYETDSASYIHHRAVSLYTYIHWKLNWNQVTPVKIQWSQDWLTKAWGEANEISRRDYVERLAEALSTSTTAIEAAPEPNFVLGLKKFIFESVWLPHQV